MRLILLFILFPITITLYAQKPHNVNKYVFFKNGQLPNAARADSILNILRAVCLEDIRTGDSLCNDFFVLAQNQNNNYTKGIAYLLKAFVCDVKQQYINGINNTLYAINLMDVKEHGKSVCFAHQLLAKFYSRTDNYDLANQSAYKALSIAEQLNDKALMVNSYSFLGIRSVTEKKYDLSLSFHRKCLNISQQTNNLTDVTKAYTNIGIVYRNLGNRDSALYYHQKSLNLATQLNNKYNIAFALSDIGVIYLRSDDYHTALSYLNRAAEIREAEGEKWELGFTYNFMAECYYYLEEKKNALRAAKKALDISFKSGNSRQRYETYEYFSAIYGDFKQFDSAYYFAKKQELLKDSVVRAKKNMSTDALVASYQFEQKEKTIQLLNEEKNSQLLKIQKQQLFIAFTVGTVLFILVITLLVIRNRKQRMDRVLLQARLQEESIKYNAAQKIQREKERISRDLHDNVGGQLSYVLYSLDGINSQDKTKSNETIKNINESVRSVIQNLRETIWAINDESFSINDFSDKLKVYARSMFRNTNTKINYSENIQQPLQLNALVGLNLYRICQEIINNAFKYSNAAQITINITTGQQTVITIADDGKGFQVEEVTGGFGLTNIKSRAAEAGITVDMETKPGQGVKYKLVV